MVGLRVTTQPFLLKLASLAKIPRVNHAMNSLRNPLRDSHHAMNSLKLASLVKLNGGLKWTRTTDLTLIRRAL